MSTSLLDEFVSETREDVNSPTTSTFVSRMSEFRQAIYNLEEVLENDREGLVKLRKTLKSVHQSGNSHVDNEAQLSRVLEKFAQANVSNKDKEQDIEAALLKFSVVTMENSRLIKALMQSLNNIVLFPLESILKKDFQDVRGDMKRPFDRAWKDYETKFAKLEKEKKQLAKEAGFIKTELTTPEITEELEKERKMFQLHMCEYLLKVNEIRTKKGAEMLQHFVEYYYAQKNYFNEGMKIFDYFGHYIEELSVNLQLIKQDQLKEREKLLDIKNLLKSSSHSLEKEPLNQVQPVGYSLHQLQGNKQHGVTRQGYLLKKSEGKMRRVWQRRKCIVQDGFLCVHHADETKSPTEVNLLTCQIKNVPEDKKCFDLVSYNRTYHFQADSDDEKEAWMSVLINCKENALQKALDSGGKVVDGCGNPGLLELQQAIIRCVQRLDGNDRCCDCDSQNDATWLSTNYGIIVCIECSGIHRDLGVHISRIQSLNLDKIGTSQLLLARCMSNHRFNEVMEAKLYDTRKPTAESSMEERYTFIRAKYVEKKYVLGSSADKDELMRDLEMSIKERNVYDLLQIFSLGGDLTAPLPSSELGETALHDSIAHEDGSTIHIVDFLVQNCPNLNVVTCQGNTPLHYAAMFGKSECMKLLLRSGAKPAIPNQDGKTPSDIAKFQGYTTCEELLEDGLLNKKSVFDNVSIEWDLPVDDGSTDMSDDDTIEDRGRENGAITPEKRSHSRLSGYILDSPRPRSATVEGSKHLSLINGSRSLINGCRPPPPPQSKKPTLNMNSHNTMNTHGSLKKRVAPPPPSISYGTLPSSHSRSPSDPMVGGHRRSPSTDSSSPVTCNNVTNRTVFSVTRDSPTLSTVISIKDGSPPNKYVRSTSDKVRNNGGIVQRPNCPPPPAPSPLTADKMRKMSNGRSTESISSMTSDSEVGSTGHTPEPLPRRKLESPQARRCRALYDCQADNEDELTFSQGEVIVIVSIDTEDENWAIGVIDGEPMRKGLFPMCYVSMMSD